MEQSKATASLGLLLLGLATLVTAQDMSIVNGDPDHEVDDAGTIRMIFTTNLPHKLCQFTTADNIELEPVSCDVADIFGTCLASYTLPEDRPALWRYKYAALNNTENDCGIDLSRVTLKDSGKWKVNICADAEKTNCVEGEINLLVKGNEIQSSSLSGSGANVDPGSRVTAVFRTRLTHDSCRFTTPDGYTLHVVNGKVDVYDKHPDDTVRPDSWKYTWFGFNDTFRDCGIRLQSLHPADHGTWTVRVGNVGEPSADVTENFTISVTDFELQVEPVEATGDEGMKLLALYRVTYPYENCVFTTPDGHELHAVKCKPEEDIEPCITKYNATWSDPAREPGMWTYQYQYWNNSKLDCGIQINSPVTIDTGNWTFSITSITGEVIKRSIHMNVQENELVVEDFDPNVVEGNQATMVFRSRLPYDTCIFTTPQGNMIDLVAGLPTVYNKTWEDAGERPNGDWTYSWFAWNSTTRDCGIRIHRVVPADKGDWTVTIGKKTGTILTSSFTIDVREPSTTTQTVPTTTTAAGSTTSGTGGSTTSGTGGSTTSGGTGGSTTAGGEESTTEGPNTAAGVSLSWVTLLAFLLVNQIISSKLL